MVDFWLEPDTLTEPEFFFGEFFHVSEILDIDLSLSVFHSRDVVQTKVPSLSFQPCLRAHATVSRNHGIVLSIFLS